MSNYQQAAPPPVIPRLSPQIRAGLAGIRDAEGTTGPKAYSTAFTGVQFDNSLPHQGIVRGSRNGYRSDAAGAYQFKKSTWDGQGGGAMTPARQDWYATKLWLARVGLPRNQHGVNELTRLLVKNNGISSGMSHKMAPEWASFPTHAGVSYYGQPVKSLSRINKTYHSSLPGYQQEDKVMTAIESPTGIADLYKGTNKPSGPKEINMLNILNKETQGAWKSLLIGK